MFLQFITIHVYVMILMFKELLSILVLNYVTNILLCETFNIILYVVIIITTLFLFIFQEENRSHRKSHKHKKHKEESTNSKKETAKSKKKNQGGGELDSSSDVDRLEEFLGTGETAGTVNQQYEVF